MKASTWGTISAANNPCTTRASTSTHAAPASAQASEARVKPATPITKARRNPSRLPKRAPVINPTANVRVYPDSIA